MKVRTVGAALVLLAAALLIAFGARAQNPLDSLIVCRQTQTLIFENAFVRVIDDVIPPGVSEPKHHHPHGVVVALADADTQTHTYPGGTVARRHTKAGSATWNEALTHDVTNVGSAPTHFIRIDLK